MPGLQNLGATELTNNECDTECDSDFRFNFKKQNLAGVLTVESRVL